jgi:hypothetical protein
MKTLKSIMLGLALLLVGSATNAATVKAAKLTRAAAKLTRAHAINTYVDAMTRGKISGLNDVLDKTATFSMLRGKTVLCYSKKQMLDYFKSNKNTEQVCTLSTGIIKSDDNIAIVKVDMKYNGFVRSNYVTIANTGDGWKITNVYSVIGGGRA